MAELDVQAANRTDLPSPENRAALDAVTQQARQKLQLGYQLAARGAIYSAELEFLAVLRLVTRTLDQQQSTARHGKALASALRALHESEDFSPRGRQLDADLNVSRLVASHRTPALKERSLQEVTPLTALQQYFAYASHQLSDACRDVSVASEALYALGRIHGAVEQSIEGPRELASPKGVVFFQAALAADAWNHLAANELGVLLARYGQLQPARDVLQKSLAIQPLPETWHNLAVVYERMGNPDAAAAARQRMAMATGQPAVAARPGTQATAEQPVRWVSNNQFNSQFNGQFNSQFNGQFNGQLNGQGQPQGGRMP